MRSPDSVVVQRSDYTPPAYQVPTTALRFRLDPVRTEVVSELYVVREEGVADTVPLELHGVDLELVAVNVDGVPVADSDKQLSSTGLTLHRLPAACVVEIITHIAPDSNTAFEGLYRSNGVYCTQCEAEGYWPTAIQFRNNNLTTVGIKKYGMTRFRNPVIYLHWWRAT